MHFVTPPLAYYRMDDEEYEISNIYFNSFLILLSTQLNETPGQLQKPLYWDKILCYRIKEDIGIVVNKIAIIGYF